MYRVSGELRRIAEGREAEVFAAGDGAVLRLMRATSAAARADVAREAALLRALEGSALRVPRVLGEVERDGRPGLLLERLPGPDLLSELAAKPWRVFAIGATTGRLQAQLAMLPAPPGLGPLRPAVEAAITRATMPAVLREFALALLERLPDGDRLCHLDFHPGNLLRTGTGDPAVIDWANARAGDPLADLARSIVILSTGELPPGTPLYLRVLSRAARSLLLRSYLGAYAGAAAIDRRQLRRWEAVMLAARLDDAVPGERPGILRRLEQRRVAARRAAVSRRRRPR